MPSTPTTSLNDSIIQTLDACIGKMADCLQKTFDPQDAESLKLFKQFCSALNARRQWLKALQNGDGQKMVDKEKQIVRMLDQKPMKNFAEPSWTEKMANRPNPNLPMHTDGKPNGLLIR